MAIAPVNKFLSVAVPVHPGEQLLYEVPTGTSAILLYAQVSNVGIGTTYPTISFIHRRESRSTGNCLLYTSPSPRDQRGSGMAACA